MSQSRKEKKRKMVIPCKFKRGECWEKANEDFQIIKCENSGRVVPTENTNEER